MPRRPRCPPPPCTSPAAANEVSPEEWQTRVDLAAAYRLVALFSWDDLVFTHISARVPGSEDQFLINPYGLMFEEITASSLVQGRRSRQQARRLAVHGEPGRLHDPQRHARGAPRRAVRAAHALAQRHRGVGAEGRRAAAVAAVDLRAVAAWATTTTKAWRCATTRSRGWCATSATRRYLMLRNHGLLTRRAARSPMRSSRCTCSRPPARSRCAPWPAAVS